MSTTIDEGYEFTYIDEDRYLKALQDIRDANPPNPPDGKKKRKRTAIPNSEWLITIQLRAGDSDGTVGHPLELRYADSALAASPRNIGSLIATAMEQRALQLRKEVRKRK